MENLSALPAAPVPHELMALSLAKPRQVDPQRIDKVAREFDGVFYSLLLKELRQSLEPDTLFPQDSSDVLGGLFDMFLGQHLAQSGSLGIGALVKKQLLAMQSSGGGSGGAKPPAAS